MLQQQGVWYVPGKERKSVESVVVGGHKEMWRGDAGKMGRGTNESKSLGCGKFTLDPRMTPNFQC